MAFLSKNDAPGGARRRFLRTTGLAAIGLPLALALPAAAAAAAQAQNYDLAEADPTSLPRMAQRVIPATGERLPVVGCGTWRTFDVGDEPAARAQLAQVLRILFEAGGSTIDSSPMYGSSEAVAGALLTQLDAHNKAFIATKVWTEGREAGIAQMEDRCGAFSNRASI